VHFCEPYLPASATCLCLTIVAAACLGPLCWWTLTCLAVTLPATFLLPASYRQHCPLCGVVALQCTCCGAFIFCDMLFSISLPSRMAATPGGGGKYQRGDGAGGGPAAWRRKAAWWAA